MNMAYSKNNVFIRLTEERWFHIVENHDDLAGKVTEVLETVAEPDIIVRGIKKELLAAKKVNTKWLVVVYKEIDNKDGFIVTAFTTSRSQYLMKKEIIWTKQ